MLAGLFRSSYPPASVTARMAVQTSYLDTLLAEQTVALSQRLVLMLRPNDEDRGRLDPVADALSDHLRVRWLDRETLGLDQARAATWKSLIRATQVHYGPRIPALGEAAGLGEMTAKHLKTLGRLARVPPNLARPLAALARLPLPGLRGRRAALWALAGYRGERNALGYLDRAAYRDFSAEALEHLTAGASPAEGPLKEADPLLVVALLRPDDPTFSELTLACDRQSVPLLAVQVDDRDLIGRGRLFFQPWRVAVRDNSEPAALEAADIAEKRRIAPAEALFERHRASDLFAAQIRPPAEKMRLTRANARRGSAAHAYSADVIIQKYCGLPNPPVIPAYWPHGWLPSVLTEQPMLVARHKTTAGLRDEEVRDRIECEKKTVVQWVARPLDAEVLARHGYDHVDVVGLPFCYLPDTGATREPGSLLVMPHHGNVLDDDQLALEADYAAYIDSIAGRFSRVIVMVSPGDHWRGSWSPAFRARRFEVVLGTEPMSVDAMVRMKHLFQSIEFLTTPGFGSHIPYAASCGVKVSMAGPMRAMNPASFETSYTWRMFPETRVNHMKMYDPDVMRDFFPFLFTDPWRATDQTAWGAAEIGMPNRLSPGAMRTLIETRTRDPGLATRPPPTCATPKAVKPCCGLRSDPSGGQP